MATSGVLKITTRLAKKEFKKDLKSLTKDIKVAETETNAMASDTEAMSTGLGASVGSLVKIGIIAGLIVGAFVLIKKAVENIVKNNEEVAGKIEAIKNALSNIGQALVNVVADIILPIIEKIVDFVYLILSYVNAITKAWWNYDLFSEQASDNLESGASSAKAIEKALAGFDTADVLGKEDTGKATKNMKKYKGELKEVPKWLQKIIDSKSKLDVLFSGAKEGIQLISEKAKNVWEWLNKYNPAIALITGGVDKMKEAVKNLADWWSRTSQNIQQNHPILSTLVAILDPALLITTLIARNWDSVSTFISNSINWVQKLINKFRDLYEDYVKPLVDKIEEMGTIEVGEKKISLTKGVSSATKSVPSAYSLGEALGSKIRKIFNANGGVVNNPGKGVAINQIIAGEKGPEAILPLTDGTLQKIASMIPVQIELTNTIDGRVLSRRLETIRQNTAFSRNGG